VATEASLISSTRLELGDNLESFRDSFRGTGDKDDYDLPARNISGPVSVFVVGGDEAIINLTEGDDYEVDRAEGRITFTTPPEKDAFYVVEGKANGIFTDAEVTHFLEGALAQHLKGRTVQVRYRDGNGFIRYDRKAMELEDLPKEEEILVTLLATIEALWALSTDASTDIDVTTSEGTHIPRGQRFRQLQAQIELLTNKYHDLSLMMGVGLHAPEVMNLRRVSRTTGRLVPVFHEREYDEHGPPIRKLPPRSDRDEDEDGPSNPYWSGGWGF
jgi:hypothetical protein